MHSMAAISSPYVFSGDSQLSSVISMLLQQMMAIFDQRLHADMGFGWP